MFRASERIFFYREIKDLLNKGKPYVLGKRLIDFATGF